MDVETLIELAGGVVRLADRLGVARTTVLDWRRTGTIPGSRVGQIATELTVAADDLLPLVQKPRASTRAAAA